jgi:hypothetical protein
LLLNFTKCGYFNLWKIVKIVVTRCQILRLKCTESISAGAEPQTPLGELTALPRSSSWIYGSLLLRGGEGQAGREETGEEGR